MPHGALRGRLRIGGWIIFIAVFILSVCWVVESSQAFKDCVKQTKYDHGYESLHKDGPTVRRFLVVGSLNIACAGDFADKKQGPLTAIATVIISIFTIILVAVTGRQAKLTGDSVRIAEKALTEVERAFVFIDGFSDELSLKADSMQIGEIAFYKKTGDDPELFLTRFAAHPRWKNSRNTPTKNMKIQVDWQNFGARPPTQFPPPYTKIPDFLFIGPNAIELSEGKDMSRAPQALIDFEIENPVRGPPLILIWGRAEYEDVFGHPHFVEWCYRLRLERHDGKRIRAHFIQWGEYNRTDGPQKN